MRDSSWIRQGNDWMKEINSDKDGIREAVLTSVPWKSKIKRNTETIQGLFCEWVQEEEHINIG